MKAYFPKIFLCASLGLIVYFSQLFFISVTFAQQSANKTSAIQQELDRVNNKIRKERKRIKALDKKERKLRKSISSAQNDLKETRATKVRFKKELVESQIRLKELIVGIKKVKKVMKSLYSAARTRIVAGYKQKRSTVIYDYLFSSESIVELQKRSKYWSIIAKYDRVRFGKLAQLADRLSKEQLELKDMRVSRQQGLHDIAQLTKDLKSKEFSAGKLLGELREQKRKQKRVLARYQESADKLQNVLADIMGKTIIKPDIMKPPSAKLPVGVGLASLKGKLAVPVVGPVVRKFGAEKHEEFSDIFFVKGLEFHTAVGAKVRAVASGTVIFSQIIPEYGNVVIVDHGKRYYTLYGRLASNLTQVNDRIESGDTIAVLGEAGKKGRNFYFELRYKGKAKDPWGYFKNPPEFQPTEGKA